MSETGSVPPSGDGSAPHKDRHEPRGRKPNDKLPPSRAREVQRAFRLRRAEHLASLEERILNLELENNQLRALLSLPIADRGKIGSGPTGRGKALKEGGVPMSERVRARKEARERERRALGLVEPESSEDLDMDFSDSMADRDTATLSPRAASAGPSHTQNQNQNSNHGHSNLGTSSTPQQQQQQQQQLQPPLPPLFNSSTDVSPAGFNYQLPMPFNLPVSPEPSFSDFTHNLGSAGLYKSTGATPNFNGMFSMFDTPPPSASTSAPPEPSPSEFQPRQINLQKPSPISPPIPTPASSSSVGTGTSQPDLLTRLKACCHVSDSHVVNDPGSLVFATRLCQAFGCSHGGGHPDPHPQSDSEYLVLEDSWRALRSTLDPDGDSDGENRINTGKMAAELVIRAAHQRGAGGWIVCRFREGLSIKKSMIVALVTGLGGRYE